MKLIHCTRLIFVFRFSVMMCIRSGYGDGNALTARRFKKQIFLSVDVPPTFLSMGNGPRLLLEVERALVGRLKEYEGL